MGMGGIEDPAAAAIQGGTDGNAPPEEEGPGGMLHGEARGEGGHALPRPGCSEVEAAVDADGIARSNLSRALVAADEGPLLADPAEDGPTGAEGAQRAGSSPRRSSCCRCRPMAMPTGIDPNTERKLCYNIGGFLCRNFHTFKTNLLYCCQSQINQPLNYCGMPAYNLPVDPDVAPPVVFALECPDADEEIFPDGDFLAECPFEAEEDDGAPPFFFEPW
jgi:hypothetical protein